jgi:Tfp pilus assembly protein PilF
MSAGDRLEALKGFLEQDPDDSFTRYALALEYIGRGDESTGIALLRETIERDPAYVPGWHMLALQLVKTGDFGVARAVFEEGIRVARSTGDTHAASEMEMEMEEAGV